MLESNKVKTSEDGKAKLRKALQNQNLTQEKLAHQANVSIDTVKRLLGTKDCPNGVERWAVKNIAEVLNIKPTNIINYKDWYPQWQLLPEFELLIREKTKSFCGRKFVFDSIEEFFSNNPNGYFTVVGDAGMGKTAIAAQYIVDHPEAICFFNIRAEGMNRPDLFFKKIRQQLIERYDLQTADDADLPTILTKVSEKLSVSERLVIVVDALDEVDQEPSGNLLLLPTIVPEHIYFVLTRRPYNPEEKRLHFSPSIPTQELDLRQYLDENNQDVKKYISQFLNDKEYQDMLNQWIQKQNHISIHDFVETIAIKSENNFMYLRCVLPAIADGFYDNKNLDALPIGLQGYYYNHWQLMGMTSKPLPKNKIKIIYVMSALRRAASRAVIGKYSKQNELTVQEVLDEWVQFLQKEENVQPIRYRFYHESFIDFLHRQDIVQAAGVNLPTVSAELAEIITGGLFSDE
jgi:hypothetical protein